jgi:hypothetical protein
VITGTGRAGTSFLVQLFSALGFDTGYSMEEAFDDVDAGQSDTSSTERANGID